MPKLVEGLADKIAVPAGARDIFVFDTEVAGFGIRKFSTGKSYYIIKYAVAGKTRRQSLGEVTRGNLKSMRALASEVKARARLGQDLIAEKPVAAAQNAQNAITLGYLVPIYLKARKGELREKSLSEVTRYLNSTWKPLYKHPIDAITRQHIVGVVDSLPYKVAADRARTALSALFSWAIEAGHASSNPTMHIASRAKNGSRNRVLSEPELREVWNASLDNDHGRIVKLLILTGQRRNEIADLAWPEIDQDKRQIDLPEHRTKNGRPHSVPLSAEAFEILKARTDERDLLFGRGAGGFSGWSKAKADLDERIAANRKKAGIRKTMPPWTLHDIRRTVVTHLVESRTRNNGSSKEETWSFAQPHVVEMLVNHVSGHKAAIAGTYNKALYLSERRQALEQWGAHIAQLVR